MDRKFDILSDEQKRRRPSVPAPVFFWERPRRVFVWSVRAQDWVSLENSGHTEDVFVELVRNGTWEREPDQNNQFHFRGHNGWQVNEQVVVYYRPTRETEQAIQTRLAGAQSCLRCGNIVSN